MASYPNEQIVLKRRPQGAPSPDDFALETSTTPPLGNDEVLVQTEHLSIDAFIRTVLYEEAYHAPVPIGGTVSAIGVGRVLESRFDGLEPGDGVVGPLGAQTHALVNGAALQRVRRPDLPLRTYLGVLGLTTGLTAYFGMREVGKVAPGETVLISAAAGAVGSIAAQIAKLEGGRVIGIAGGPEKGEFLRRELGLDGALDYRAGELGEQLRAAAPDGIDVFFDNVGGDILDVALDQIRERGRIVICGAISQYDNMDDVRGPRLYLRLAERHARMEGFAVTHFAPRFREAEEQLATWLDAKQLAMREQIVDGIAQFPEALLMLFSGGNTGKLLVQV